MMTATDTNLQVTPSPPSVVSPIKAYNYVDLTRKKQNNNNDPPARSKNNLGTSEEDDRITTDNSTSSVVVWKQVISFLSLLTLTLCTIVCYLINRVMNQLPIKIDIVKKVLEVTVLIHKTLPLAEGFTLIRGWLKTKTSHVQNQYAR